MPAARSRRRAAAKSAIAQTRNPPKRKRSASVPLASRCAKAQTFTERSIGWPSRAFIRPAGTTKAARRMKATRFRAIGEMAQPDRRGPQQHWILPRHPVAPDDQDEPDDRGQRIEPLPGAFAQARDRSRRQSSAKIRTECAPRKMIRPRIRTSMDRSLRNGAAAWASPAGSPLQGVWPAPAARAAWRCTRRSSRYRWCLPSRAFRLPPWRHAAHVGRLHSGRR